MFTSERQYRNALAREHGFASWYAQQQAPAPEVRGRRDFRKLRPSEQDAYQKTGSVLTRMRHGLSLTKAARLEHTTPAAVKRHAGDALVPSSDGTYLVTTTDRHFRRLLLVTPDGVTIVETKDSRAASLVAEYDAAIQRFLAKGDASGLARFEGQILRTGGRRYPFVTDLDTLETLGRRGEISFESIYATAA